MYIHVAGYTSIQDTPPPSYTPYHPPPQTEATQFLCFAETIGLALTGFSYFALSP